MDEELDAIVRGMQLRERAVKQIEKNRYTDKPGDYWHVESSERGPGFPYFNGIKAIARLNATDDGYAYSVQIYTYKGNLLTTVIRKTLNSAFAIGIKLAHEGVDNA